MRHNVAPEPVIMLRNTNLNLLRTLHVLLQEAHVSKAAQRLHITQSAVSRQLAQLRDIWQDELLVRNGNVLIMTPKAEMLKAKLDTLMDDFDLLLAETVFDPENWFGELVLSSSDYVAQYVMPDVCKRLNTQAPNLAVSLRLWEPEYIHRLHELNIDIASTMLPQKPDGISGIRIGADHSVLVMHQSHPLASKKHVTVNELIAYPHIKITGGADKDTFVDDILRQQDLQRRVHLRVPFFNAALSHLQVFDGLMVMPEHIAESLGDSWNIVYKPLPFNVNENQYWLIWHPKYDNDIRHKWAREQVKDAIAHCESSIQL